MTNCQSTTRTFFRGLLALALAGGLALAVQVAQQPQPAGASALPVWSSQQLATNLYTTGNSAFISAVNCSSSGVCAAGGSYRDAAWLDHGLAAVSTDGGANWVSSDLPSSLTSEGHDQVDAVSCPSSSLCVAGGTFAQPFTGMGTGGTGAFVSTTTDGGSSWTDHQLVVSLNVGNNAEVTSISCPSSSLCVATGRYQPGLTGQQAFVSTSTDGGNTWTDQVIAASLNQGDGAALNSVSCPSASLCIAGGYYSDASYHQNALLSVSTDGGATWTSKTLAASLNAVGAAQVDSVSCAVSGLCVAGGWYMDSSYQIRALVSSSTNGFTSWTDQTVATGLSGSDTSKVVAVSCSSASTCVAGGSKGDKAYTSTTTNGGASWSDHELARGLNPLSSMAITFKALSCSSTGLCTAGGKYTDSFYTQQAYASTSTDGGATWSDQKVASSLNTAGSAETQALSCTSADLCVAAGHFANWSGNGNQIFAARQSRAKPAAPTPVVAVAGDSSATVSWSAPAPNGSSPVTSYTVTASPGENGCYVSTANPFYDMACVVPNLTNGTEYTFSVVATNDFGDSPAATSSAVTPSTVPDAPTDVAGVAGDGAVVVSWTPGASDGGAAVTSYTVTASPDGASCTASAPSTSCTVTGLSNGTAYTFSVVATNLRGDSTPSDASPSAQPAVDGNLRCLNPKAYILSGDTLLSSTDRSTWTAEGSTSTLLVNAAGFGKDGNLYGIGPKNHLVRTTTSNQRTDLGSIAGLPRKTSFIAGDVDPSTGGLGTLYVSTKTQLYAVNLSARTASPEATPSGFLRGSDLVLVGQGADRWIFTTGKRQVIGFKLGSSTLVSHRTPLAASKVNLIAAAGGNAILAFSGTSAVTFSGILSGSFQAVRSGSTSSWGLVGNQWDGALAC